jgi:hypothetical protein
MDIGRKYTYVGGGQRTRDDIDNLDEDFDSNTPYIITKIDSSGLLPYYMHALTNENYSSWWVSELALTTNFIPMGNRPESADRPELLDYINYRGLSADLEEYLKTSRKLKGL